MESSLDGDPRNDCCITLGDAFMRASVHVRDRFYAVVILQCTTTLSMEDLAEGGLLRVYDHTLDRDEMHPFATRKRWLNGSAAVAIEEAIRREADRIGLTAGETDDDR